MSQIKKYKVVHEPTFAEIEVQIDFDFPNVRDSIKAMVDFWNGSEDRLLQNDGKYVDTFLKQLCHKVVSILGMYNHSAFGVIQELKDAEGWCPLDGTSGITLLDCSSPDLDSQDDFSIEEIINA